MPTATAEKVKIKSIQICQAEGRLDDPKCGKKRTFRTMKGAHRYMASLERPSLGYNKVDFWINYQDGSEYSGTYCLGKDGLDAGQDLRGHVKSHLLFCAGLANPTHIDENCYRSLIENYAKEGIMQDAEKWLKEYEI